MRTFTHLLTTAVLDRFVPEERIPKHTTGFLIGAVLPDIPFALLTVVYEVYYRWLATPPENPYGSVMEYLHFDLFFNDPVWIIGHNLFHSLVVVTALLGIGYFALRRNQRWGVVLFWLSAGMLIHTVIDVLTHSSDGPLLFFPLNWTARFASPVSYWEAAHFGTVFTIIEYSINAVILVYFGMRWWKRRYSAA